MLLIIFHFSIVKAEEIDSLIIGRATDNVVKEYERLFPIAQYLGERIGMEGKIEGGVYLDGQNSDQMVINAIKEGDLHLILESCFSSAMYQKNTDMVPLLLVERDGFVMYESYIFVRKDSDLETLDDLLGKKIAFEDPTSTSSFRWPRNSLQKMGYRVLPKGEWAGDAINYIFGGSELNVSSFVFYGKVAAGALSSVDWLDNKDNPPSYREAFEIIYETPSIPRMFVMVSSSLTTDFRERIKRVLLSMHTNESGRKALENYQINRFVPLTPQAVEILEEISSQR